MGEKGRPRLSIYRSLKNLTAQLIDDTSNRTILSVSTFDKEIRSKIKYGGNVKAAESLGKLLAEKAKAKGITTINFDRGGRLYHGRIKAFADAARKDGLIF
jgi:large subunit ribosomal protein L18